MKNISISSYIGIITAILVSQSVLYIGWFYKAFEVSIFGFMDVSEIMLDFVANLISPLMATIIGFFSIVYIINYKLLGKEKVKEDLSDDSEDSEFRKTPWYRKSWFRYPMLLLLILVGVGIFTFIAFDMYGNINEAVSNAAIIILASVLLSFMLTFGIYYLKDGPASILKYELAYAGGIMMFFSFMTIVIAEMDVQQLKKTKGKRNVEIVLMDGAKINTDSTNYYIGRKRNYVFIYNEKERSTTVYKESEIKTIKFTKKKK